MRKGFATLAAQAEAVLKQDPFSGQAILIESDERSSEAGSSRPLDGSK
jgi:hypothetical protein